MPILDLGHKTIDADGLVIVRPISDADLATANTREPWKTLKRWRWAWASPSRGGLIIPAMWTGPSQTARRGHPGAGLTMNGTDPDHS